MLCWTWAMYFSAAPSSENDQGSMNLASNTAATPSTMPSRVAAIQGIDATLDVPDLPPGVALVPATIELFGRPAELHNEVARQVLRFGFAPFFSPEADQRSFVVAHYDPGV